MQNLGALGKNKARQFSSQFFIGKFLARFRPDGKRISLGLDPGGSNVAAPQLLAKI
jgi:hypothetical protein